jgi:hypothetical protein
LDRILFTDQWIGTTECATILRSSGIRAEIVNFILPFIQGVSEEEILKHSEEWEDYGFLLDGRNGNEGKEIKRIEENLREGKRARETRNEGAEDEVVCIEQAVSGDCKENIDPIRRLASGLGPSHVTHIFVDDENFLSSSSSSSSTPSTSSSSSSKTSLRSSSRKPHR